MVSAGVRGWALMSSKEVHGAVRADRQAVDLVRHEQGGMGEDTQPAGQLAGAMNGKLTVAADLVFLG